ncbi:MAG: hypothetical protein JNM63_02665, partial [Spirochaetia bacterium]|nr:hypothetical protein [Spirochaetia bacterium]
FGQEVIASLIPDDEVYTFTRLSPKSLSHFGRHDLVHRALFLDEFVGNEDESSSQLRALLSRGSITTGISTVDTATGKVLTVTKDVLGPIALFSSTTNENKIDDETRSRFVILPIDESEDQTKRVFGTMVSQSTARGFLLGHEREEIRRRYRMIQKVLRPLGVVIPDEWRDKIEFNSARISQKRRFQGYLSFLSAVALHRQYQREIKTLVMPDGRGIEVVEVTRDDIVLTNRVIERLYPEAPDDLNPVDRRMLADIREYCDRQGENAGVPATDVSFTRRDIREASRWDPTPCRRTFERLLELEYIERQYGRARSRSHYRLSGVTTGPDSTGPGGTAKPRLWCPDG